jgi:flagellar P-ring protein precursor FlgI
VKAKDGAAKRLDLPGGATVDDFVRGLQAMGATARDIVAILQAIKEAGGLQAELEIL